MIDATTRLVLTSGVVYSSRFPFSSSVILDSGRIAWIGDDGGLNGQLLDSDTHVTCEGSLIAPLFFDAGLTTTTDADAGVAAALVASHDGLNLMQRTASHGWQASADVTGMTCIEIKTTADLPEDFRELTDSRSAVIVGPDLPPDSLSKLAAAGVPFAFGSFSGSTNPWNWVQHAVYGSSSGLSARAAFNASTRSGWRMVGRPEQGELRIGGTCAIGVWRCEQFEVQVPDDRIRAWSTDERAGTPALPDLRPDAALPRLVATVIDGVYRSIEQ